MEFSVRRRWVEKLHQTAYPVVDSLSRGELRKRLPLLPKEKKRGVAYLEAFGRTFSGIAPWLSAEPEDAWEAALQQEYIEKIRLCLTVCTDPESPDYFVWQADEKQRQNQPLVDAAYFVSGLLKARQVLWESMDEALRRQVLEAITMVSKIRCNMNNNWCMFTAMIEAGLFALKGECDTMKLGCCLTAMEDFYLGDGTYGDGVQFAWDYYNSYVMQPFLEQVTALTGPMFEEDDFGRVYRKTIVLRMQRYCEVQERLIAPDGTYVATGRSSAYRMGAFQSLAHLAWRGLLPESLPSGQVRNALNKVLERIFTAPSLFDGEGFLQPGIYGYQPGVRDSYINTGSLYLCCGIFLPLGLDAGDPFWQCPDLPITWEKAWSGENTAGDVTLTERK